MKRISSAYKCLFKDLRICTSGFLMFIGIDIFVVRIAKLSNLNLCRKKFPKLLENIKDLKNY